ncbi:MAG TPA: tRNA (uridine(34)/cytosine(34)/5-carboxymethylaminomethyluridine(34)-2'-O)-methyltransferase TrmL [Gammaproteobacteria bacterium]|nr:tRNA (uridine(34)/cytosine(34)/5-carboxymethylaminomethyluridine(34)-2'-O)-methyltransferase TrmL [Gammaproteobacteria bacterium]
MPVFTHDGCNLQVVLFEPEIPPNTGNIIRLCANSGARLHLIRPLGFVLEDRQLRRAGLDYHEWAKVAVHDDFARFLEQARPTRLVSLSTHHLRSYHSFSFVVGDALLFGPETRGLPAAIRDYPPPQQRLTLPMMPQSRSLNLSNSVAIVVYEAWRQLHFGGAAPL